MAINQIMTFECSSGDFRLAFGTVKDGSGNVDFVIHASTNLYFGKGLFKFLEDIGFSHFNGQCPFHRDRCYYRIIGRVRSTPYALDDFDQTLNFRKNFDRFAENIGDLYSLYKEQNDILRSIGEQARHPTVFTVPPIIEIESSDIPLWAEQVKFGKLKELESRVKEINEEIKELRGYVPLLYASGDPLAEAVVKALRYLGLKAEPTEKGATVDAFAETEDGTKKFGIEVTGVSEGIKKSSRKLTQVLEFERVKDNDEKTILVADTYNTIPISKRRDKEHFTQPVIDFLSPHPILLMTSWDIYRMVQDVMETGKNPEDIINLLHSSKGVLTYGSSD